MLQVLGVLVDRLDRADQVQQRSENAADDHVPHIVLRHHRLHADADDAADLRRFQQQRLGLHLDVVRAQFRQRAFAVGDVVRDRQQRAVAEECMVMQLPAQDRLEQAHRLRRRRIAPEHLAFVRFFLDAEDRYQRIGINDRIDFQKQVLDEFAPVAHHVRGDDEFFQQPDLEFEHALIDRDAPDLLHQQRHVVEGLIEFLEAEIDLAHIEMVEVLDGID